MTNLVNNILFDKNRVYDCNFPTAYYAKRVVLLVCFYKIIEVDHQTSVNKNTLFLNKIGKHQMSRKILENIVLTTVLVKIAIILEMFYLFWNNNQSIFLDFFLETLIRIVL